MNTATQSTAREVRISAGDAWLYGDLVLPPGFAGLVLFAHGSGSGRHSARNRQVAQRLQQAGIATLLFDLLTVAGGAGRLANARTPLRHRRC